MIQLTYSLMVNIHISSRALAFSRIKDSLNPNANIMLLIQDMLGQTSHSWYLSHIWLHTITRNLGQGEWKDRHYSNDNIYWLARTSQDVISTISPLCSKPTQAPSWITSLPMQTPIRVLCNLCLPFWSPSREQGLTPMACYLMPFGRWLSLIMCLLVALNMLMLWLILALALPMTLHCQGKRKLMPLKS